MTERPKNHEGNIEMTEIEKDARIAELRKALKTCNELLERAWAENRRLGDQYINLAQDFIALAIKPKEGEG